MFVTAKQRGMGLAKDGFLLGYGMPNLAPFHAHTDPSKNIFGIFRVSSMPFICLAPTNS